MIHRLVAAVVLALFATPLFFTIGCGISKEEMNLEIDKVRKENAQLKQELEAKDSQLDQSVNTRTGETKSFTEAKLKELDAKYTEYKQDANNFKALVKDIDLLRKRNIEIYGRLRNLLLGQQRFVETERNQLKDRGEILEYVAQTLKGILSDLGEFAEGAPNGNTPGGNNPGGGGSGDNK